MRAPRTRYVDNDGVSIAYQVVGDGPLDLVVIMGSWWHLEFQWTDPSTDRFLRRLAGFARVILYDKRGTGLSDRVHEADLPSLEERMDDLRAVLDAVGSERCALFGDSEGGPMAILYAATYPERTSHLLLYGSYARMAAAPDYPAGTPQAILDTFIEGAAATWGEPDPAMLRLFAPSLPPDAPEVEWLAAMSRHAVSPRGMRTLMRMMMETDVRGALAAVSTPTLVLHRGGDRVCPAAGGRYLAEHIPGARYVELPGDDHAFALGDTEPLLAEIEEFLTGVRPEAEPDRVLATILFTDIVGSTERAARLGDRAWRDLLDRHDAAVRAELVRHRGREVKQTGDGFLAAFDGPARAARCAAAIREAAHRIGIQIRAGVHTGECEVRGDDLGGIAVHIAARVGSLAGAGEVLVSSTVRDLTAGSGIDFDDRGEHELRGVPGLWRLFAVTAT